MANKLQTILFVTICLVTYSGQYSAGNNVTSEEITRFDYRGVSLPLTRLPHLYTYKHRIQTEPRLRFSTSNVVTTTISTAPAQPVQDRDHLVRAINEFGFKLMTTMMKQKGDENVVISPAGIAGLLAMTLLGTVGVTYVELTAAVGFSQDILTNRVNHEQLGDLLRALNANGSVTQTSYADAIFVDARTQVRSFYRDYLKRIYSGEAMPADFKDASKAKDLINDWVKVNTNGKIADFLYDPLPTNTKVVLLSALYFTGQWKKPFVPEYTRQMAFKNKSGKDVLTDFMLNAGHFNYTFSKMDGFHIVALHYQDFSTTMYALMPYLSKQMSITDLMDKLNYQKIYDAINKMTEENCIIKFPKMKLKSRVDLVAALKELGVKSMFSPTEANFALMVDSNTIPNKTDDELILRINEGDDGEERVLKDIVNSLHNPGVYVDSVLHDVKITIDEFGTEAVAATSGVVARSARLFYADSPFFMFIRDEKTKLVTFSAIIMDPTSV